MKKLDELVYSFGDRKCKSAEPFTDEKEEDYRRIKSFPLSPVAGEILVADPPRPFSPILKDNCYAERFGGPAELILNPNES